MKPIYPYSRDGDPDAVPAAQPQSEVDVGVTAFTVEVDGQAFALRPDEFGGTEYTWLSGPNPGYGFSVSPTPNLSLDEHRRKITDFLAMVDPSTGYIEDD